MAGKKTLVVATVEPDEAQLREALADSDEIRVLAPAAQISWLDWLTNAEDDARAKAHEVADRTADAAGGEARVEIDRTSENTDPAADIEDALRNFPADEIVILTRSGEDASWLEDDAVRAVLDAPGLPVRRVDVG